MFPTRKRKKTRKEKESNNMFNQSHLIFHETSEPTKVNNAAYFVIYQGINLPCSLNIYKVKKGVKKREINQIYWSKESGKRKKESPFLFFDYESSFC